MTAPHLPTRTAGAYPILVGALLLLLVFTASIAAGANAERPSPPDDPARELSLLMRKLDRTARILYVTAHPDDEDAGLLARLVHGEGVEVGLLTVTRGEGGQNEIGTELFHALGVLRSRELEAAARYTGVSQYFTRAFEFGYSFSVEETYEKWGRDAILRDIVRVVRRFRPDVILTLPHVGEGGGQHHQATARLASDAFEAAASSEWPELGTPHETARLFRQVWDETEHVEHHCNIELGTYDDVLGASYEEVGVESRAAHKCQGMARYSDPLPSRLSRWEWRHASGDDPSATIHFLDDLPEPLLETDGETTAFGRALREGVAAARAAHMGGGRDRLVGELLSLHDLVGAARAERRDDGGALVRLATLEERISRAIVLASGLRLRARSTKRHVAPGDTLFVTVEAQNTGGKPISVDLTFGGRGAEQAKVLRIDADTDRGRGRFPGSGDTSLLRMTPGGHARAEFALVISPDAAPTIAQPVPAYGDDIDDAAAERFLEPTWRAFLLAPTLAIGDRRIAPPPVTVSCQELDAAFPSIFYSDPHIVPEPSVRFARDVVPAPLGRDGAVVGIDLLVSSLRGGDVSVSFDAPDAWVLETGGVTVKTPRGGVEVPVRVVLRVPEAVKPREDVELRAVARFVGGGGGESESGYRRVEYRHVRPDALHESARVRVVPFDCAVDDRVHVGYVEGAGDRVLEAFDVLGVPVDVLDEEALSEADLDAYDVLVTGVRAYKVRSDLVGAHARILDWVAEGGTLIVQYNKFEFNAGAAESPYAPFPGTRVGARRVTVEESPVTVNVPEHAVFTTPNAIGPADWEGWVQERGLYFLDVSDPRYLDLLTLRDPWPYNAGEEGGSLVLAPVGSGEWVYVGLGLFRQLPAGVPGAYRLLANLLSLGAE